VLHVTRDGGPRLGYGGASGAPPHGRRAHRSHDKAVGPDARYFRGFRWPAIFAPDGTPCAPQLSSKEVDEREVALALLDRCAGRGGETLRATRLRRARFRRLGPNAAPPSCARAARTNPPSGPHLAPLTQRIESIFWTCKDHEGQASGRPGRRWPRASKSWRLVWGHGRPRLLPFVVAAPVSAPHYAEAATTVVGPTGENPRGWGGKSAIMALRARCGECAVASASDRARTTAIGSDF
jgi:hypothetical protein